MKPKGNKKSRQSSYFNESITNMFSYLHNHVHALNNSKLFAGLMIITLNIASKFVTVKLSKSMEAYLKYTFSRQILIFTIAWMGTRDIYIALIVSLVFMVCMDFLFNEESSFCCLPADFTDYHVQLFDTNQTNLPMGQGQGQGQGQGPTITKPPTSELVTDEEIQKAKSILDRAKQQNGQLQYQSFYKDYQ